MRRLFVLALLLTLSCGSAAWAEDGGPGANNVGIVHAAKASGMAAHPVQSVSNTSASSQTAAHPAVVSRVQAAPNVVASLPAKTQASHQQTHAAAPSNPVSRGDSASNSSGSHPATHPSAPSNPVSRGNSGSSPSRSSHSHGQNHPSVPSNPVSSGDPSHAVSPSNPSRSSGSNNGARFTTVNYTDDSSTNVSSTEVSVVSSNYYYGVETGGEQDCRWDDRECARKDRWRNRWASFGYPLTEQTEVVQTEFIPTKVMTWDEDAADAEIYVSEDGTRAVKIDKESRDAFLYDRTETPDFNPVFLASDVKSAQFSDNGSEGSLQVMLTLRDGSFGLFDGQGNAYQAYASSETATVEPIDEMSQR